MGLLRSVQIGLFAARVSSALLDIGLDANKFHPMLSDSLLALEREQFKVKGPHETAALFLLTYMPALPSSTFIFSKSLPELVDRTDAVLALWVKKGKMKEEIAAQYSIVLHEKLESHMRVVEEL